jgi:hypothetical protein
VAEEVSITFSVTISGEKNVKTKITLPTTILKTYPNKPWRAIPEAPERALQSGF